MITLIEQVGSFILVPIGMMGIGLRLKRSLIPKSNSIDIGSEPVISFALGLIFFSYYWFAMGCLGFLTRPALYLYYFISLLVISRQRNDAQSAWKKIKVFLKEVSDDGFLSKLLLGQVAVLLFLVIARSGSASIEGDSLIYHLFLPKQYVAAGRIWDIPFSEHAFWPFLAEACFLPGEIIGSLTLSKLISCFVYMATGLMVGAYVYRKTESPSASLFAAFLLWSSPVFFIHAPSTYNDLFVNFFTILGFLLYLNLRENPNVLRRSMFLSGLMFGAALACKYTAFYGLFALSPIIIFDFIRSQKKKAYLQGVSLFGVGIFITGAVYYVRSYLKYSNPVFPFAATIFNTDYGYPLNALDSIASNQTVFSGAGRNLFDFILLPFNITFRPSLFGDEKIGFFFIVFGILIFFSRILKSRFVFFALFYAIIWFILAQLTRYLIPVLTVLAIVTGVGFYRLLSKHPAWKKSFMVTVILIGLFHVAWSGYHSYKDLMFYSNDEILQAVHEINSWVSDKKSRVLIIGESRLYYFDFRPIREKPFRHFTRYPELNTPKELADLLEDHAIAYLLFFESTSAVHAEDSNRTPSFEALPYFKRLIDEGYFSMQGESKVHSMKYQLYHHTQPY